MKGMYSVIRRKTIKIIEMFPAFTWKGVIERRHELCSQRAKINGEARILNWLFVRNVEFVLNCSDSFTHAYVIFKIQKLSMHISEFRKRRIFKVQSQ